MKRCHHAGLELRRLAVQDELLVQARDETEEEDLSEGRTHYLYLIGWPDGMADALCLLGDSRWVPCAGKGSVALIKTTKQRHEAMLELNMRRSAQDMKFFLAVAENKTDTDSSTSMGVIRGHRMTRHSCCSKHYPQT
eukprot:1996457-Amphidinium_carterae.1